MVRTGSALLVAVFCCLAVSIVAVRRQLCFHDERMRGFKYSEVRMSEARRRSLQGATTLTRPINIQFDFSGLKYLAPEKSSFIMNNLMPNVKRLLQGILSVKYIPGQKWGIPMDTCQDKPVPKGLKMNVIEADLLLFVTFEPSSKENAGAWAAYCYLDPVTKRPRAGQINYIESSIKTDPKDYREMFERTIHELIHVLGFSKSLYDYWVDQNGQKLGIDKVMKNVVLRKEPTKLIITPLVKQFTQEHYGCWEAEGAELENQGGSGSAGSHWERRNWMNEIMTASALEGRVLSKLTLKLLESTGWYVVNYDGAQRLNWAKSAGCKFLTEPCYDQSGKAIYEGFCQKMDVEGCSLSHYSRGHCSWSKQAGSINVNFIYHEQRIALDPFADNCPYFEGYSNGDCRDTRNQAGFDKPDYYDQAWGSRSRCFNGNFVKNDAHSKWVFETNADGSMTEQHSTCHNFKCVLDPASKRPVVQITIGTTEINCPWYGGKQSIPGYKGQIDCPDGEKFCVEEVMNECGWNNHCNGVGFCWKNQCVCPEGTYGPSCEKIDCAKNKCNGRGTCLDGKCQCQAGYGGAECEREYLSTNCGFCPSRVCHGKNCIASIEEIIFN